MNIDYNDFYRLRVDIYKVNESPLYELLIERVDIRDKFESTVQKYIFEKEQLKQFVNYINEATHDYI